MNRRRSRIPHGRWSSLVLLLLLAGCDLPGKPNPEDAPVLPDQITDFDDLFATNCAGCHGATGELGPAPPLNDPLFVAIISDEDLEHVIRHGRTGTPMPPFELESGGSLSDQQIAAITGGIRKTWGTKDPGPDSLPPYKLAADLAGEAGSQTLQHGEQLFARACAGCHGTNGQEGPDDDLMAGPLNTKPFLALISDQAIRRIIITGRPDLGMPDFAATDGRPDDFHPLTSAEIDDLVALIAHWRDTSAQATPGVASLDHLNAQP